MVNQKDLRAGVGKMREVAELLCGWADDMERSLEEKPRGEGLGDAVVVADAADGVSADGAVVGAASVPLSYEELRGLLAAKSAAGYRTQVLALIRSFGAEKLSEVDPAHYAELAAAAGSLGGGTGAG